MLKIDKDSHVTSQLERVYVQETIATLRKHHITVVSVKATTTHHGRHYYIEIDPSVDAHTANNLQYLLGDDAKRVSYNEARINSELAHWNILFEAVGRKLRTVYSNAARKAET